MKNWKLTCTLVAFLVPLKSLAFAATYERPAGAYTPSNHSVNTTKYQTDSANHTAISSAKVDGDFNKAYQALNELDVRTPPSVSGNADKYLTNNGTSATWASLNLSQTSIASGSTGVYTNSATTISFTTAGVTSNYIASAGLLVANAGISTSLVSTTNASVTTLQAGSITLGGSAFGAASASTIISGTDNKLFATALSLANCTGTTTGRCEFAGGYILQWGSGTMTATNNGTGSANFSKAFPNSCFYSFANVADDGSINGSQSLATSCSTSAITVRVGNTTNAGNDTGFVYFAIGK